MPTSGISEGGHTLLMLAVLLLVLLPFGCSRGCGFLPYTSREEAEAVLAALNDQRWWCGSADACSAAAGGQL